jgi:hypothetical protein
MCVCVCVCVCVKPGIHNLLDLVQRMLHSYNTLHQYASKRMSPLLKKPSVFFLKIPTIGELIISQKEKYD